jgi:hypothetical protein
MRARYICNDFPTCILVRHPLTVKIDAGGGHWSRCALSLVVTPYSLRRIEYFRSSFESVMFLTFFPPSLVAL